MRISRQMLLFVIGPCSATMLLIPTAAAGVYPSMAYHSEEAISNRAAWLLFWSIDGFNNTPNATCGDSMNAMVRWNGSSGQ